MNNEPKRSENMPTKAVWDSKEQEWYLGETINGKNIGLWKWWHKKGYFWVESEYDQKGKLLWYKRYHPDGTMASSCEGYTEKGNLKGEMIMVKCKVKTPEDFYDMFGAKYNNDKSVWKIVSVRADDGERIKQYIYDKDGNMSRKPWYHDMISTTYAAYITEEDKKFIAETEKKQEEAKNFMEDFEKKLKERDSKYTTITKRITSGNMELLEMEEAIEKYDLPDIEYLTDGNEGIVLVLKDDAVIEGDFLTEHEEEICGIYAMKNLTIIGSIIGDWDYMWIYVLGNLKTDNIIVGDGVIEVLNNIEVSNTIMKLSGEGAIHGHGNISAALVLSDLPVEIRGKIIKGTIINTSDDQGFNTTLCQHTSKDISKVIIPQIIDPDEDCYTIDKKKATSIVRCGKSILLQS